MSDEQTENSEITRLTAAGLIEHRNIQRTEGKPGFGSKIRSTLSSRYSRNDVMNEDGSLHSCCHALQNKRLSKLQHPPVALMFDVLHIFVAEVAQAVQEFTCRRRPGEGRQRWRAEERL